MELTVAERLTLLDILPKQGDFATVRSVRELREALSFDDDAEEVGLKETKLGDGRVSLTCPNWELSKPFDIPPRLVALIVSTLAEKDRSKTLEEKHYSLYEKFVGAE